MVEVASSNLVTPTKFESPNLYGWGFFYAAKKPTIRKAQQLKGTKKEQKKRASNEALFLTVMALVA